MPSSFTWLQFDAEQARRTRELVRALQEPGTLDSLGIGTIRDGFANLLLPGTSTIQTRVRYFLLVPWAYQHVAASRPRNRAAFDRRLRDVEVATIESLIQHSAGEDGIIGRERRRNLRTMPSSIYWTGLGAWGIRLADHLTGSAVRDQALSSHRRDDDTPFLVWDTLPPAPPGFPHEPLALHPTEEEGRYLLQKMAGTVLPLAADDDAPSLLARVARQPASAHHEHPWDVDPALLTPTLRLLLAHARAFALTIHGARLRYLDLLFHAKAAHGNHPPGRDQLGRLTEEWLEEMATHQDAVSGWEPEGMLAELSRHGVRIAPLAQDFVRRWCTAALRDPEAAVSSDAMGEAIRDREITLKRSSARLGHRAALDAWNGELVGSGRLDFRWAVARRHVLECLEATDVQR